jgi:dolichol-phosphate mannosyltransferase
MLTMFGLQRGLDGDLRGYTRMFEDSRIEGRVIVVNDGSTDRTGDIARSFKAGFQLELLEWERNRGLAEALRQGLFHASSGSKDGDIIVTMDADSSHPPDLIPQMVARAGEGTQVVIASRYRKGSTVRGLAPSRRALSWGASYLFRFSYLSES